MVLLVPAAWLRRGGRGEIESEIVETADPSFLDARASRCVPVTGGDVTPPPILTGGPLLAALSVTAKAARDVSHVDSLVVRKVEG